MLKHINLSNIHPGYSLALNYLHKMAILLFRSVSSLKSQMEKEKRNHRQEYLRKLKENSFLLQEIEQLKKELKSAQEYKIPAHIIAKSLPSTGRKSSISRAGSIDR